MAVNTAAGAKLAIGPSVVKTAADSLAELEALSYVEIGEIETLGDIGDAAADVTFTSLSDSRVRHLKGARDAGVLPVTVGRDPLDAGQAAMIVAEGTGSEYAFRITYNDKPNATGTPTIEYFRGAVRSKRSAVGSANTVVTRSFDVGVNSEIFEDIATVGV